MNRMALTLMKRLTGCEDTDILKACYEDAESRVLNLTNRSYIPARLESTVMDYAVVIYNRLGTEGDASRNEGGISSSFAEIPKYIQDSIDQNRIARCGGRAHEA